MAEFPLVMQGMQAMHGVASSDHMNVDHKIPKEAYVLELAMEEIVKLKQQKEDLSASAVKAILDGVKVFDLRHPYDPSYLRQMTLGEGRIIWTVEYPVIFPYPADMMSTGTFQFDNLLFFGTDIVDIYQGPTTRITGSSRGLLTFGVFKP
jgi:hypothetical protein